MIIKAEDIRRVNGKRLSLRMVEGAVDDNIHSAL